MHLISAIWALHTYVLFTFHFWYTIWNWEAMVQTFFSSLLVGLLGRVKVCAKKIKLQILQGTDCF